MPGGTPGGPYTIQAIYYGTATFFGSVDVSHILSVNGASSKTTAANISTTYNTAQPITLGTATVTSTAAAVNQGTVTFTIESGGVPVGKPVTGSVASGAATATYTLPPGTPTGTYAIQAIYNGTPSFLGSSDASHALTVSGAATTAAAVSSSATYSGTAQPVTLSATVVSTAGTVNQGTVTFNVLSGTTPIGTPVSGNVVNAPPAPVSTCPAAPPAAVTRSRPSTAAGQTSSGSPTPATP